MYRALIVEDEDLMREYLAAKLSELCPEWEAGATASDGMEAVERMAHERFDAVLTDIRMPGMDGLELARYIRRTDAQLPILILSGYDEFNYARAAMKLNVFDYLLKPLNEEELSAALTSMAALAALRKTASTAQATFAALAGEPAALASLRQKAAEKSVGVLMIAPSLLLPPSIRAKVLVTLAENITGGLWKAEQVSADMVAVFCAAPDPLLVATEGRALYSRACERYTDYPLHAGFTPFEPARAQATAAEAEAALRVALSTNVAWVSQPLLYAQRKHLCMLEALRGNLAAALAQKTLNDQHRGALLAALRDVPPPSAVTSAACLLWESDADSHARVSALLTLLGTSAGPINETDFHQTERNSPLIANGKTELRPLPDFLMLTSQTVSPEKTVERFSMALDCLFQPEIGTAQPASALVERARDYLRLHFSEPISLSSLADTLGITSAYLSTLFHREMGLSYSRYLLNLRMARIRCTG